MNATTTTTPDGVKQSGSGRRGTRGSKPQTPWRQPKKGNQSQRRKESAWSYTYISPFFIIFIIFGMIPILYSVLISFYKWGNDPLDPVHTFIGVDNFCCGEYSLVRDPLFWTATRNTFSIFILSTIPMMFMALGIASILRNPRLKGRLFWQTLLLVPNITSVVAVAAVFGQLYGREFGLINYALTHWFGFFGFDQNVDWQENTVASHVAVASMITWRWLGYNSLIFLASMNAIPKDLYESASLDGATRFQQFRFVTLPQLRNTITFMLIMGTIGGLSVFAEPLTFIGSSLGGSHSQLLTLTMYLFYYVNEAGSYGYAAAIGIGITFIVVIFSGLNFILTRRIASEDAK